jgi:hypothetical protein
MIELEPEDFLSDEEIDDMDKQATKDVIDMITSSIC